MKKKLTKKENSWEDIPAIYQERILNSYKESFNAENWIEHENVKAMVKREYPSVKTQYSNI